MRTVLVSGGAGFIGSNFVRYFLDAVPDAALLNVDALSYAGNLNNLEGMREGPRYRFERADIADRAAMETLFGRYDVKAVVNLAAESHVDRSIEDPGAFVRTNVLGAQVLLDCALRRWRLDRDDPRCREYADGVKFLQVSTDEVYGSLGPHGLFTEDSPLAPCNPYAATKAAADHLALAYGHTYGLPVCVTRSGNNYGPYQHGEKFIPRMIASALRGEALPLYGDGLQVRDWVHVGDHCAALGAVLARGRPGLVYNVGAGCEKTNAELAAAILSQLGLPSDRVEHVPDRPGHDRRYAMDASRLRTELGWSPRVSFDECLRETVAWYAGRAGA